MNNGSEWHVRCGVSTMRLLKDIVKRVIWSLGKDIVIRPAIISRNEDKVLEISLGLVLSDVYLRVPNMTILQIGAYDGRSGDPVHDFLTRHSVRSVLVEPQPTAFERLALTYKQCPHVTLVNAAIAPEDGEMLFYAVRPTSSGPDWMFQLASFNKTVLLKHKKYLPDLEAMIQTTTVNCLSPRSLLRSQGITRLDVLIVDAEGHDAELIRAFQRIDVRPTVLFFEHKHLSRNDYDECVMGLVADGYRIASLKDDTLAYRTVTDSWTTVGKNSLPTVECAASAIGTIGDFIPTDVSV